MDLSSSPAARYCWLQAATLLSRVATFAYGFGSISWVQIAGPSYGVKFPTVLVVGGGTGYYQWKYGLPPLAKGTEHASRSQRE